MLRISVVTRISIHAPTRGATADAKADATTKAFQSTLPRGERHALRLGTRSRTPFQSTLPRGERPAPLETSGLIFRISIHAPTRGATASTRQRKLYQRTFQSTLPRGERLCGHVDTPLIMQFQSTLPRGERRNGPDYDCSSFVDFNPRSHEGSDACGKPCWTFS